MRLIENIVMRGSLVQLIAINLNENTKLKSCFCSGIINKNKQFFINYFAKDFSHYSLRQTKVHKFSIFIIKTFMKYFHNQCF